MTSRTLNILFLFLFLTSFLLFVSINIFGQTDISVSKKRLELLKVMLEQIDEEQRKELSDLQKRSTEKDEFETTRQYEERAERQSKESTHLYNEIDNQQGAKREKIFREMNLIFGKEFPGTFNATLGTYNADKQQFPIYSYLGIDNVLFVPLNEAKSFKEHFDECKKEGINGLLLDQDNKAKEYMISGKVICKEKTYNLDVSSLTASRAMKMVFGNYDEISKQSEWTLFLIRFYIDGSDEDEYLPASVYAKALTLKSYLDQGVEKRVLIAQTAPTLEDNSCHACSVFISVAVFSKKNGYWKIEQVQKNTGSYGSWGEVSPPDIIKIGDKKYALRYSSYYMGMGQESGSEYYVTLDGGIFNGILSIQTFESNLATAAPIKDQMTSKSKVVFRPIADSEYFEVVVTTVGKKGKKTGARYLLAPFVKTEKYRVSNGKYILL